MFNLFKSSFGELKKTKTIVICGFLLALSLVLNTQAIKLGSITIITFSFIANSIAGFLFGPIAAAILGGTTDVLGHIIAPKGSYFFGYTLNSILAGILYGSFLYRKQWKLKNLPIRIITCKILISIFINLTLGTIWTSMFTGKGFLLLLPPRISKELVVIPIHCLVMYVLIKVMNRYYYVLNIDNENN